MMRYINLRFTFTYLLYLLVVAYAMTDWMRDCNTVTQYTNTIYSPVAGV